MGWQTLLVQNPASLNLKQQQLLCRQRGTEQEITLPIEDLSVIILESPQIRLTSALLGYLQSNNVVVMTCDDKHMPNGLLLPFHQHSRYAQVASLQINWTEPFKKRCWQQIIQHKIQNQALCLKHCEQDGHELLEGLAKDVLSGDSGNKEAHAAKLYWSFLFGKGFQRFNNQSQISSALNYGYAVLRACMARSVVATGLLPSLGLHHCNNLNAFNLVDDLLEPFRPFIDYKVYELKNGMEQDDNPEELSLAIRQELASIGSLDCLINNETYTISNACDKVAESLVQAIRQKEPKQLKLPQN